MCCTKGLTVKAEILDESAIARAVTRISFEILERNKGTEGLCLIGLFSRGAVLAQRIAAKIAEVEGSDVPVGLLDITPFRDDKPRTSAEDSSRIDFDIADKSVVIVDDVIFTGRTARAALEALPKFGRASSIRLAVLIDRGHRELPIRGDYVGKNVPTSKSEHIKVKMPPFEAVTAVELHG